MTSVTIVGAGLAGLAAAEMLAAESKQADNHDPFRIRVIEAKRVAGGRAGSFHDPADEQAVDYCQHVAMGCCTEFLNLMDRCGLAGDFRRYGELSFHHPDHPPSRFAASRLLPVPLHLTATLARLRYLSRRQKLAVVQAMWHLLKTPSENVAAITAGDWLRDHGQDEATIDAFWDVVLISALGEQTRRVSMAAARKVFVDGFLANRDVGDVIVPARPLSELFGKRLINTLASRGVEVQTGRTVRSIRASGQTGGEVALGDGELHRSDHVIIAVPWYRAAKLVDDSLTGVVPDLSRFPGSPISGLHLWLDREITTRAHAVLVGTMSQWLFRRPTGSDEHYYQVVISASRDIRRMDRDELLRHVMGDLAVAFPAAGGAVVKRFRVVTDPNSVFSLTPHFDAARPPARTVLPWLHLAGDWIATGWPATMEGAVIGGRMAATSVLQSEQLDAPDISRSPKRSGLARWMIRP